MDLKINTIKKFNFFNNKKEENINAIDYIDIKEDKILSEDETKRLNYLFDTIIRKSYKKLNKENKKVTYKDYICSNELCERIFKVKEQNKIKNYLTKYFILRKIPIINKIDEKYNTLNKIINELEIISDYNINSYNDLIKVGSLFYNKKNKKNKFTTKLINNALNKHNNIEKNDIVNKNENIKSEIKTEEKTKENNLEVNKDIKELKSTRNKLLYRIRKLELELSQLNNNDNKINYLKHELKMCKLAILEIENDLLNQKQNNDEYNDRIVKSYDKKYEGAIKTINAYIRKYNNKSIKETICDYFGIDQVNYFRSLGIDVNSILNEKIKIKRK